MKPLSVWLATAFVIFGTFCGAYHAYLTHSPRRVLVVVDTSFSMRPVWRQVPAELEDLNRRRYTQFSLVTEKKRIHGWSPKLELGSVSPFAPRNFSKLENEDRYREFKEATEIHLITGADDASTKRFTGCFIHRLR